MFIGGLPPSVQARTGVRGRSILVAVCALYIALCFQAACAATSEAQTQTVKAQSRQIPHARDLAPTYPPDAVLELPELSKAEEKQVIELIGNTSRFYTSINRPVSVAADNWRRVGERNGFSIWQLHIRSPGAKGVKVWFSEFDLPDDMTVKVYGPGDHLSINKYAGKGLFDSTRFWSLLIPGDTLIVEVWSVSGGALSPGDFPFEIPWLDHHFQSDANNVQQLKHYSMRSAAQSNRCPFENGSFLNGKCFPSDPKFAKGIAKINYAPPPGEGSGGQCTGGILSSESPAENGFYLMTAYHCIEEGSHPEMAIGTRMINLSIDIGDSRCVPPNQIIKGVQGASFVAGGEASDHALLWVESPVLSSSDFYRYGWTTESLTDRDRLTILHHANGTRQNVASGFIVDLEDQVARRGRIRYFRSCTDSSDFYCSHYAVDYTVGDTAGGASGAPVIIHSSALVNGIHTNDRDQCAGRTSRFTRIFEDERVSCALEDDLDGGAGNCANRLRLRAMSAFVLRFEARPETEIPDNTDDQSVSSTISVDEDFTFKSLLISMLHSHRRITDLKIELITPGGRSLVLKEVGDDLTTGEFILPRSLMEDFYSVRGEWTLTVGDYVRHRVGTLAAWRMEFSGGDDDSLEETRMLAGDTTRVTIELENSGLLERLPERRFFLGIFPFTVRRDETVEVSLSSKTVSVDRPTLTLTAAAPSAQVFVRVPHDTLSGKLVVTGRTFLNGRLTRAAVEPVTLPVEIVPREFTLAFVAPGGEILRQARILAGGLTSFRLVVSGTQTPLGISRLFADETLTAGFAYDGGAGVTPPPVSLTSDEASNRVETPVTFTVAPDAADGTLTVSGRDLVNATVEPATLPVEIVPREFTLAFAAPGGEILRQARILAGGLTSFRLIVSGTRTPLGISRLFADETLTASFAYDGGAGVTPPPVSLTSDETSNRVETPVTFTVAPDAADGTLTVSGRDPVNATVEPASLPVEIVPREFTLAFTAPGGEILREARILAGGLTSFRLIVSGTRTPLGISRLFAGETLTVDFAYDGGAGVTPPVSLTSGEASNRIETPVTFTVAPDAVDGTLTMSGNGPVNAAVEPATLPVEIVPREFTLAFAAPGGEVLRQARMLAGSSIKLRLIVSGTRTPLGISRLFADETLTVGFAYDGGAGVTPPPPISLTPDEASNRVETPVTFTVAPDAVDGTLTMSGHGPVNAVVEPATLPVEIVPREFTLALAAPAPGGEILRKARMLAGGSTNFRLIVSGTQTPLGISRLFAGETLTVGLAYDGGAGATPTPVSLTPDEASSRIETPVTFTVAPDAVDGTLTMSGNGLVNATVEPATLPVEIVPREFTLALAALAPGGETLRKARMLAGGSTSFRLIVSGTQTPLGISRLFADETLTVGFAYDGGTGTLPPVSLTPDEASNRIETPVTFTVVPDAVDGTLTVSGHVPVNAAVEPASLPVEIVPREFRLALAVPGGEILREARMLAGGSTSFRLIVSGIQTPLGIPRLFAGETLTVGFAYDGGAGVTPPPPVSLTPDEASSRIETPVTFTVAPDAVDGTLMMSGNGPVNAVVEPVTLPVEIVPREFRLAFAATPQGEALREYQLAASGETPVWVRLLGVESSLGVSSLNTDETLTAELAYTGGAGMKVSPSMLEFAEGISEIEVTLSATLSAQASALVASADSAADSADLPNVMAVEPATLRVVIVPRQFGLVFAPRKIIIGTGKTRTVQLLLTVPDMQSRLADEERLEASLARVGGSLPSTVITLVPTTVAFTRDSAVTTLTVETTIEIEGSEEGSEAIWEATSFTVLERTQDIDPARFAAIFRTKARLRVRVLLEGPLQ